MTSLRLVFLADLAETARTELRARLETVRVADDQLAFTMVAPEVLAKSDADSTRETFAVVASDGPDERVVGIGVLQPSTVADRHYPADSIILRGFSIDLAEQGKGHGTRATALAVEAAAARHPGASHVVLCVHVDNAAGRRAYERVGFTATGELVAGRAGQEHVMVLPLT